MALTVEKLVVGPLESNCYLVMDNESKETLIIDPGDQDERILACVQANGLKTTAIVLTHSHGDHIGGVAAVKEATGAPILIHRQEADWITDPEKNLSAVLGMPVTSPPADRTLEEGATIPIGKASLRVLHTPGHSPGGLSLYREGMLFSGDLLFRESVGRVDLPGGDAAALIESIKSKVFSLPDETIVYPGHGESTTIGYEKQHNPFVR